MQQPANTHLTLKCYCVLFMACACLIHYLMQWILIAVSSISINQWIFLDETALSMLKITRGSSHLAILLVLFPMGMIAVLARHWRKQKKCPDSMWIVGTSFMALLLLGLVTITLSPLLFLIAIDGFLSALLATSIIVMVEKKQNTQYP